MKRTLLILVTVVSSAQAQLFSFDSGSGVPTQTAMGGLLGAVIAPMISKGQDAKLVGGILGAATMNAVGTQMARQNGYNGNPQYQQSLQQEQMRYYIQQQQMQMASMQQQINQMAQMNTASGRTSITPSYDSVRDGIVDGKMVKSPYSKFKVDPKSMNLDSGEVLYDPFTGKPFRIP